MDLSHGEATQRSLYESESESVSVSGGVRKSESVSDHEGVMSDVFKAHRQALEDSLLQPVCGDGK